MDQAGVPESDGLPAPGSGLLDPKPLQKPGEQRAAGPGRAGAERVGTRTERTREGEQFLSLWMVVAFTNLRTTCWHLFAPRKARPSHFPRRLQWFRSCGFPGARNRIVWGSIGGLCLCQVLGSQALPITQASLVPGNPHAWPRSPSLCPGPRGGEEPSVGLRCPAYGARTSVDQCAQGPSIPIRPGRGGGGGCPDPLALLRLPRRMYPPLQRERRCLFSLGSFHLR